MATVDAKETGAFYTPPIVASTLVKWAVRRSTDRLLDPSCGDGGFLLHHVGSTGVEQDRQAAIVASRRARGSTVHVEDFFSYACRTTQRFDCAAGNPPFIRYQRFAGEIRQRALALCEKVGVKLSGLTSSWAPFLVATASLLKPDGRLAFVVPAEIGHAPYAAPLLRYLCASFARVQVVLIRNSVFDRLSQDIGLLYADGYGRSAQQIQLNFWTEFRTMVMPPRPSQRVSVKEWEEWSCRLRPFLISNDVRQLYRWLSSESNIFRFGDTARIGIGYVTGDNEFFHLRPSQAVAAQIPKRFLLPTVRSGRVLQTGSVDKETLSSWIRRDEPCLLLRLSPRQVIPDVIYRYLDSTAGLKARTAYKCRNRTPWYSVPDVIIPDGFLTYMSGDGPNVVGNAADCTCTNSVHAIRMKNGHRFSDVRSAWLHPVVQLSAELEGHPLGGGMLKLEPREACRIMLPRPALRFTKAELKQLVDARNALRAWRHYE